MRNKIRVIFEEMINTVTYVPELYVLVESLVTWWATGRCAIICLSWSSMFLYVLYYYMRNFCNLIGLEQWYFSLI